MQISTSNVILAKMIKSFTESICRQQSLKYNQARRILFTWEELPTMTGILLPIQNVHVPGEDEYCGLSFAEKVLKCQRRSSKKETNASINTKFLIPTSNGQPRVLFITTQSSTEDVWGAYVLEQDSVFMEYCAGRIGFEWKEQWPFSELSEPK